MNIKGKKVTLRAIEEGDLQLLVSMLNDPEIENLVGGWSFPLSLYQEKKWFENNYKDSNNIRLVIETEDDGAIGLATLTNIDWKNRIAYHGIKLVNKKFSSKGIGTDSVMAIMDYAFNQLQLNRLEGAIIEYNIASKKLYCDKCGWTIEGTQRQKIYKNGKYNDRFIVAILKDDYLNLISQNNYWNKN